MKRSILRALALCLTTTFATGYACAQDENDKSADSKSQLPQSTASSGTGFYSTQAGPAVRLSRLMNTTLKGQAGESLGQVQDIVVDPTSGQVQFVVISLSGSAAAAPGSGTGGITTDPSVSSPRSAPSNIGSYGTIRGKFVAIPWRLMSHASGDQYTATIGRTHLESAPAFNSTSWPTMDSAWMQRVYSHFGVDAANTGRPGSSSGTRTGTGTGTGLNPSTPGLPATPGTPDINAPAPSTSPSATPGTSPGNAGSGSGGRN